ncbi:hypothetical protein [Streptomyces sp. NL15-2K]|uniref:hypothetical protein n=1 Tax=Streptomyces sp. NL15-2K TaxID=376149 RepID=UPI000FFA80CA|nr:MULTISPECIES: hypothetical protein [Actinomycetes]WKX09506.1 hypothetical protein Q4V64_19225 [Kutzneria buriramensis]GCB48985.1 hypothetical protein SNL152K_6315 [Streptomyces sp. NL15-2K]
MHDRPRGRQLALTGAGLIRLTAEVSWSSILLAAAVVAVRKIAVIGVGATSRLSP